MSERVVLAYGDSNTHGTAPMATLEDTGRHGPAERWPGVLAAELGAGWRVVEEGLPGRTTVYPDPVSGVHKNGLALLPAALESHRPIDLVVLMLGTNDLKQRFQVPVVRDRASSVERCVHLIRHSYTGPGRRAAARSCWSRRRRCSRRGASPRSSRAAPRSRSAGGGLRGGGGAARRGVPRRGQVIVSSPLDGVHFDAAEHGKLGRAVAAALCDVCMRQMFAWTCKEPGVPWKRTCRGSLPGLRVDRLAALEHLDEGCDPLPRPASVFMLWVRKARAKRFCALSLPSIARAAGSASIAA